MGLEIVGMFGCGRGRFNEPENMDILGYITNHGARYSIRNNSLKEHKGLSLFGDLPLLTEEQLKTYIKNYKRKQKLEELNGRH